MAAYASLVSVLALVDQIQTHPNPPISLHKRHVESLQKSVTFLQEFLEVYSHTVIKEVAHGLESRIADVAYAAEDVIESHIVDRIHGGSTNQQAGIDHFNENFQKVIVDMDFLVKEVVEIKEKIGNRDHQPHKHLIHDSSKSPLVGVKTSMVGFDDVLEKVLDKLTGDQSNRHTIPILGMGGSGKTTLASNAYDNQLVVKHFDICSWLTISQNYNVREILLKLLDENGKEDREGLSKMSEEELGDKLYKSLYGRRYLVVLDDIWSVDVWNVISRFFPDNSNRSRIMVTTRLLSVASELSKDKNKIIMMNFLNEDESWSLFCNVVFGKEACPIELEESGKKIAKDCKGLPLSITVMGGLLANVKHTQWDWEDVAENLNFNVNLEYEENCLQILYTSYDYLPVHLKPCLLYMSILPEDSEVSRSRLIQVWIAEGFVKPICGKNLEMVAEKYLMNLIDRNLILIKCISSSTGKVKSCNIHDLVRDLCIKEAKKERFFYVQRKHSLDYEEAINGQRRIAIYGGTIENYHDYEAFRAIKSTSPVRSLICVTKDFIPRFSSRRFRILMMTSLDGYDYEPELSLEHNLQSGNLRLLWYAYDSFFTPKPKFLSSLYLLWNLQTLSLRGMYLKGFDIWKMHQLKFVSARAIQLQDPPLDGPTDVESHELVLQNLQALCNVTEFSFSEEVIKRIPNIRKLKFTTASLSEGCSKYHLSKLSHLHRLESLSCEFTPSKGDFVGNIAFPHSLIKLKLEGASLSWDDITIEVGSLPHLHVLKLKGCCNEPEWKLVEGKFQQLRVLKINDDALEDWIAEGDHFPCLEHLKLRFCLKLKEIPLGIGDAPKLKQIELTCCSDSAVTSAQKMLDEQMELGNTDLQIKARDGWAEDYVYLRPSVQDDEEHIHI